MASKQHVFWRMPNCRPYSGDDGKFAPHSLLTKYGEASTVNGKTISWNMGFEHIRYRLALASSIVILDKNDEELNENDTNSIVIKALEQTIREDGGGRAISHTQFQKIANRMASSFFRKGETPCVLVTSVSIKEVPFKRVKIGDCTITPLDRRNQKYKHPDSMTETALGQIYWGHLQSTDYVTVKVHTKGRTTNEAFKNAFHSLSLLRAIWSLFGDFRGWTIHFNSLTPTPIGKINIGPVHTLHTTDGNCVSDQIWFEPHYLKDQGIWNPGDKWGPIEDARKQAFRKIKHLSYRRSLEALLVRYAEALDNHNMSVCFLGLWSILEAITNTIGGPYANTIKRAIWIYRNRRVSKEFLEVLQFRRNYFVHSAKEGDKQDQAAYILRSFVDDHLLHLVNNTFDIESIEAYGDFLGQPTDIGRLKQLEKNVTRALRFFEADNSKRRN